MWDPCADFEKRVMPNGLTVYAAHWPNRPWQYANFVVHAGGDQDPDGQEGLAHFVEHLVSGNTTLADANAITRYADSRGGYALLGSTYMNRTQYGFMSPCDSSFNTLLGHFGQMLFEARIEHGIEAERKAILSEYHRARPQPIFVEFEYELYQTLYPGSRWGHALKVIGSPENLARFTADDAQRFYDQWYAPANVSVVSIGGLTIDEVIKNLETSPFARYKSGMRKPRAQPAHDHPKPTQRFRLRRISDYIGGENGQTTCAVKGWVVVPGRFNGFVLDLLRELLRNRLEQLLREERNWAYSVGVYLEQGDTTYEMHLASHGLPLEAEKPLPKLINQALREVAQDADALADLQQSRVLRMAMSDYSASGILKEVTQEVSYSDRVITFEDSKAQVLAVTLAQLAEVVEYILDDRGYLEIMVP